jgi:hypothetical protein
VRQAAAAAIIALRNGDGSAPPQFFLPPSSDPVEWQLTPACSSAGGAFLHWQNVTPFAAESSSQFRSAPLPELTSNEYARDYEEVMTVGATNAIARPQDRSDVARFYNAELAVSVWNQVARQLSAAAGSSLSENARALALVNMAINDALITVMETKARSGHLQEIVAEDVADPIRPDGAVAQRQSSWWRSIGLPHALPFSGLRFVEASKHEPGTGVGGERGGRQQAVAHDALRRFLSRRTGAEAADGHENTAGTESTHDLSLGARKTGARGDA